MASSMNANKVAKPKAKARLPKKPKLEPLTEAEFTTMHSQRGCESSRFWDEKSSKTIFRYCAALCRQYNPKTHREFAELAPNPVVGFLGIAPKRWEQFGFENPIDTIRRRAEQSGSDVSSLSQKRQKAQVERKERDPSSSEPAKKPKLTLIQGCPKEEAASREPEKKNGEAKIPSYKPPKEVEAPSPKNKFMALSAALATMPDWQRAYVRHFISKNLSLGSERSPDNLLRLSWVGESFCIPLRRENGDWLLQLKHIDALVFAAKLQFGSPLVRQQEITRMLKDVELYGHYRTIPYELGTRLWMVRELWASPHYSSLFEHGMSQEHNAKLEDAMDSDILESYFGSTVGIFMGQIENPREITKQFLSYAAQKRTRFDQYF